MGFAFIYIYYGSFIELFFSMLNQFINVFYANNRLPSFKIPKPFIPNNFSPWFITGLTDGDGSFIIKIFIKYFEIRI